MAPGQTPKEDTSKQECIEAKNNVFINRLPAELLIKIISYARYTRLPYSSLLFSWVCRYWRLIMLRDALSWNSIVFRQSMTAPFLQELLRRSQTAQLELSVPFEGMRLVRDLWDVLKSEAYRVKTFHLDYNRQHDRLRFSDVTSLFPFLENIICDENYPIDSSFETPCMLPHLRALQVWVRRLGNLTMPGHFPELRWLRLQVQSSINLFSLLKVLKNLPNLQILHVAPDCEGFEDSTVDQPIITLPKLKVLVTDHVISRFIDAPNIVYIEVDDYPTSFDVGRFCGFDFTKITRVYLETNGRELRITGCNDTETSFTFHPGDARWIYDPIPTSYPYKFQITIRFPIPLTEASSVFIACLKKTTNLREIFLGSPDRSEHRWEFYEMDSLFIALKSASTVRDLYVFWGCCSFATVCDFLRDGTLFPHLERLTYFSSDEDQQSLSDLEPLQSLMKQRSASRDPRPLELELHGFAPIQSELFEKIKDLHIRLTQGGSTQKWGVEAGDWKSRREQYMRWSYIN